MSLPPPRLPDALLDGWRLVEDATETPYDGAVTVTARTRTYEDAALRAETREAAGVDVAVRLFFASRLRVSPAVGVPGSLSVSLPFLRPLVARRSAESFVARLRDAGVRDVRERDAGARTVDGSRASAVEYAGELPVGDAVVRLAATVAVRTAGEGFVVTGGAFPAGVRGENGEDGTAAALADLFEPPSSYRERLTGLTAAAE